MPQNPIPKESIQVAANVLGKCSLENAVDQATSAIVLSFFDAWTVDKKRTILGTMLLAAAVPLADVMVLLFYQNTER